MGKEEKDEFLRNKDKKKQFLQGEDHYLKAKLLDRLKTDNLGLEIMIEKYKDYEK